MWTKPQTLHVVGISSDPFLAQSVPPLSTSVRVMMTGLIVISHAMLYEAMKVLGTLEAKVWNMEEGVKS